MVMAKIRQVIAARWVDELLPLLNNEYKEWDIIAYFQEHAVTKILLEKEI